MVYNNWQWQTEKLNVFISRDYLLNQPTVYELWLGMCGLEHGRPQKFFQGWQHQHFADSYQVADNAMKVYVHERLHLFYTPTPQRKTPCYDNSHKNALVWQT